MHKLLQREDIYSPFVCTSTMFSSDFPDFIMLLSTIKKWEIRRDLPEGGMMGPGRGSCQQNDEKSLQTQLLEKQEPLGWAMCFSQGFTETPPITKSHSNTGWQWTDASWHKKCLIFFSSMKTRLVYKAIKYRGQKPSHLSDAISLSLTLAQAQNIEFYFLSEGLKR